MKPVRLTAGAPLPLLVDALARCGWGVFARREFQGIRSTLHALSALLPANSAQGKITINQIADVTGFTRRWTSVLVSWLEEAGIIQYRRGEILKGKPTPGYLRISKSRLVDLIKVSRPENDRRQADRRAREQARLAALGTPTFRNHHRPARDSSQLRQWELTNRLSPSSKGKDRRPNRAAPISTTSKKSNDMQSKYSQHLPTYCTHPAGDPHTCNACRRHAMRTYQSLEKRRKANNDQLLRAYAADVYPGEQYENVHSYVRADWLAGDVDEWQRAKRVSA